MVLCFRSNLQGFPLHFDEIDAFILQLEVHPRTCTHALERTPPPPHPQGTKTWRVYAPREASDLLPRMPPTTHFEPGSHGA